jgi:hypothetical protein
MSEQERQKFIENLAIMKITSKEKATKPDTPISKKNQLPKRRNKIKP